jgi:exodeoxyribonuclease V alpha subunit
MADVQIEATLKRVIFTNPDNGYCVASFMQSDTYNSFTAAGHLEDPQEEQKYLLSGTYTMHKKYGKQFQIYAAQKVLPSEKDAVVRFLCSTDFPGIGKKSAEQIYEALGEKCLEKIAQDASVLDGVEALNEKKKRIIREGIQNYSSFNETYVQLLKYGLNDAQIQKLQNNYKDVMYVLEQDCFRPYYEISGFGYKSALKLADGLQVDSNDPRRRDAFLHASACDLVMRSGNTYITYADLYERVKGLAPALFEESLERLASADALYIEAQRIYPYDLHHEEENIARKVLDHLFKIEQTDLKTIEEEIAKIEKRENIQYDQAQKEAMKAFINESFFILNGGPGTGKSTTVKGILSLARTFFPSASIQLCAPTGRAAKRLSELSSTEAKTIHSLLKWDMDSNTFGMNEWENLECDFLIVDEFSMVDTHLFSSLLDALPKRCRILLIGDEDQLESVGPGKVFNDIIESDVVPIVHLQKIFRQSSGSGIVLLASQIRKEQTCSYEDGVRFEEKDTAQILDALKDELSGYDDAEDVQVLAPKYKGAAGIDAVNELMQSIFNPPDPAKKQMKSGQVTFREDDKVMLLRNMPEEDVFNGDIGRIMRIDVKKNEITVDFMDRLVTFDKDFLYYLSLAYCISVHKSQGGEYPNVCCIVEPTSAFMLNKRLLYTAISRAKKNLVLIGSQALFEKQVRLRQHYIRQTTLKQELAKAKAASNKF